MTGSETPSDHEHTGLRNDLGGYVLGQLPRGGSARLEEHLADCAGCRAERDELAPAAAALLELRRLRGAPDGDGSGPPPGLGPRVEAAVDADRRVEARRAFGRTAGVGAVAAVAAAAVLVAGLSLIRDEPDPPSPAAVQPTVEPVVVQVDRASIRAGAGLVAHTWGVELELEGTGFESGAAYTVWVLGTDGSRHAAGQFLGVGTTRMRCHLSSAVLRDRVSGFEVLDADGVVVVESHLT